MIKFEVFCLKKKKDLVKNPAIGDILNGYPKIVRDGLILAKTPPFPSSSPLRNRLSHYFRVGG